MPPSRSSTRRTSRCSPGARGTTRRSWGSRWPRLNNPDYAHINSVVSVGDGDIIASFRHLSAAYRIATVAHDGYAPGDIVWKLGGRDSTFAFVDDPFPGGPCAQHTVSELPNGHFLVFDNGTDGFCVDPSDRLGPGVARGRTRVTEYALDLEATPQPTATLVWSYAPAGKYAQFAGSSRRLANGNTLIGWAADRSALATEVDAAGTTVPGAPSGRPAAGQPAVRHLPCRAHHRAASPGPALRLRRRRDLRAGRRRAGQRVVHGLRRQRLGCMHLNGIVGARLDTSSLGPRTWSVTGVDGAGNTTTRTRHYTVLAAPRPDGLIRKERRCLARRRRLRLGEGPDDPAARPARADGFVAVARSERRAARRAGSGSSAPPATHGGGCATSPVAGT